MMDVNEEQGLHSTWATVDLGAIRHNVDYILNHSKTQVMAIVKANAYGHGAVPVAQAALNAGATWCGVARVNEAMELRQAGLDCSILLLGYTPEARYKEMIAHRVSLTAWNIKQVENISAAASQLNQEASIHLKVDTGMSRLGIEASDVISLLEESAHLPNVRVEGLFTHFARADEDDPTPTDAQEKLFHSLVTKLKTAGIRVPLIHASNSAASLTRPSVYFNCVRLGIAMYGLHPSAKSRLPSEFRAALNWKSVLSQVKILPQGRGISYGHDYITSQKERIGTVPVGYADGFRRVSGNQVLVRGRKVPVVGRVTMDQVMVQLDGVPDAKVGDEVVLLGEQDGTSITAEEIAGRWGTINYEVTSGISSRVPRVY
jgi:alanine racemase